MTVSHDDWAGWEGYDWPPVGAMVIAMTKTARRGWLEPIAVSGVVKLISCGEEPFVVLDNGLCFFPTLGDTWKVQP